MNKIIDGASVAQEILSYARDFIKNIKNKYKIRPSLKVIIVGDNPASQVYVKNKQKKADAIGIDAQTISLSDNISQQDLLHLIDKINKDKSINGILVQLPLPRHIDADSVINTISETKDVDCFTKQNVGKLWLQKDAILKPCTPAGCMYLIKKHLGGNISGLDAVVVGRSNIVGKPMAALLLHESCTVTITHSKTRNLEQKTRCADIVVAAVGIPKLICARHIKPGATIIDVGINRLTDKKLVGDVDFDDAIDVAKFITPVPKGVGPMTIAFLMINTVIAFCTQNNLSCDQLLHHVYSY